MLEVKNLTVFHEGTALVDHLSFSLSKGDTLGIVGESGSGKSLTSLAIMGLLPAGLTQEGSVRLHDEELTRKTRREYRNIRGKRMAMIFQEPMTALNPSMRCGTQVAEILQRHTSLKGGEIKKEVIRLFERVKLPRPESIYFSYPHQISGGQKQRVMIAMAVACKPELLIADEPTTALDVTVQAEILKLLKGLQKEYGMAVIFITHDLGVVKEVSDQILVMYRGKTIEHGSLKEIFNDPQQAYTKGLLACRPTAHTQYKKLPLVSDFVKDEKIHPELFAPGERIKIAREHMEHPPLLHIKNLQKWFGKTRLFGAGKGNVVKAVNGVSLEIYTGETLGLVGESGCGKTTLGRILCGLEKADKGEILYRGEDISRLNTSQWRKLNREIQIIFQDPFSSLNPRITVGKAIAEVLKIHQLEKPYDIRRKVEELLVRAGLEVEHYDRYPHEFSGGQRQRIGIARTLALRPRFIICDESVSALDVSVQAQIINLLNQLKEDFHFTYLFISHDLAVVKYISDRIAVMREGQLVETGFADEVYEHPQKEYTKKLIASVPEE